jgi:hypothetical protein
MEVAEKDHVLRQEELATKQRLKLDSATSEQANLELERNQAMLSAPVGGVVISGDVKDDFFPPNCDACQQGRLYRCPTTSNTPWRGRFLHSVLDS